MELKTFGQAIRELAAEKGVAEDKVVETIELAIAAAYKKDYGKKGQIVRAGFNPQTGELRFSQIKMVVDETMIKSEEEIQAEEALRDSQGTRAHAEQTQAKKETEEATEEFPPSREAEEVRKIRFNPERHIMLADAHRIKPDAELGEELAFPLELRSEFGRIASQTAKQVIIQRIREAERDATYSEYKAKEGEIVSGVVQRMEGRNVFVELGRGIGILPPEEQIPREHYTISDRLKALIVLVQKDMRGSGIFLSRAHPKFIEKLFLLEVPEIMAGTVEIKAIAREAGSRSKIAAASNDPAVDPVGSMVGQRGVRVSTVINEIGGEKIDIIEWSEDPAYFIANALSPAKVLDVTTSPERRSAKVMVPDDQLSLAIGKGGQNVRLAAKLTGWKIDVYSSATPAASQVQALAEPEISQAATEAEVPPSDGSGVPGEERPGHAAEALPRANVDPLLPKSGKPKTRPRATKKKPPPPRNEF